MLFRSFRRLQCPKSIHRMIPRLKRVHPISSRYCSFLRELRKTGFEGEIKSDLPTRLVNATDNSIYQMIPQAALFPRHKRDILRIVRLMNRDRHRTVKIVPRGGGTGTNGQALSSELVVDMSKYMNRIIEVNREEEWVRVEPGVVLDQLNDCLRPYGRFFAPTVSTSACATLGGMINTDASGKGSRVYGRTSRHLLELEAVLIDGTVLRTEALSLEELRKKKERRNIQGEIYRLLDSIVTDKRELIERTMPKTERFLTGYNLDRIYSQDRTRFDPNQLLAGSEGTLALLTEAKLKLTPIPKYNRLVLVKYGCFDDALADAKELIATDPAAVETIDERILQLAKGDAIYGKVERLIANESRTETRTINLVEFQSDSMAELERKRVRLTEYLKARSDTPHGAIGYHIAENARETAALWEFRKRAVGLLGNTKGNRRPIPFVEDTAVPPQNLASYIREFREILESFGLNYGMFGHVDVGCLHVRPALDMKLPEDEKLIRKISDRIVRLVRKHGGVVWGEHGKGFRSLYTEEFFGPELYRDLRRIKRQFDPNNRLNPGKIVTPLGSEEEIYPIDSPTRGQSDRQIRPDLAKAFENSIHCNGNGACFAYHPDEAMCPSFRLTRDRVHSPKGRAGLLREWLRLLSQAEYGLETDRNANPLLNFLQRGFNTFGRLCGLYDFTHEVHLALKGCLSCKACASRCPIKVDISAFKAKFQHIYYRRYLRPPRDLLVGNIEAAAERLSRFPAPVNFVLRRKAIRNLIDWTTGLTDIPLFSSPSAEIELQKRGARRWDVRPPHRTEEPGKKTDAVVLLQDAFTSFYDADVVASTYDVLTKLDVEVYILPFFPNGKPHHIKGYLEKFGRTARRAVEVLSEVARREVPIVGIDPAMVLTYRDEYPKMLGRSCPEANVLLLQEWMSNRLPDLRRRWSRLRTAGSGRKFHLFGHCTETTAVPESQTMWQSIFSAFDQNLEPVRTGCCGMGGTYGHESEHREGSRGIFAASWEKKIETLRKENQTILATGYSCRCQAKRFAGIKTLHPMEALSELMP